MICFWKPDTKGRLNLMTFEEKLRDAQNQTQSLRMLEYLDTGKLQDELRMTPKNAGLNHRGPSINDVCTLPCPNVKFSTQTRKRSSNLHLLCSQSPAKKVKKLINFFGGGCGGKAEGENLHTEPAKNRKIVPKSLD